jgi:hypothetical protein
LDHEIEVLLNLSGYRHYNREDGFWVKIEACKVNPTKERPHGIKYSLTLHDRNGTRIVGFDNAHNIKPPKGRKFSGRKITYDHKHKLERVFDYPFESPAQLLEDFWEEVKRITTIK